MVGFCGTDIIHIALWQRSQWWVSLGADSIHIAPWQRSQCCVYVGRAVFTLYYGREVSGGFLWDEQYSHCTMAAKSVFGLRGTGSIHIALWQRSQWWVSVGRTVFTLHYGSEVNEVSVGFTWAGSIHIALWQRSQWWVYVGRAVFALHYGSEVNVGFTWEGQYSHCTMADKSVLGLRGTGSIHIALWQRSQWWVSVGRAVFALHYGSEVSVGFTRDGQYSHGTMAEKSVVGLRGTGSIHIALWQRSQCWVYVGQAVFTLHYGREASVGFTWDGQYSHCTMAEK